MQKDELQQWENKCIQEEPPECTATCPIHVDARLFVKEMARGDGEAAYKVLARTMPFPGILGRICDHPCELRCKRSEVEAPIAIGLLERRCVENASARVRIQPLSRRKQRVAVLGGGFAGLCGAWDLLKKGFGVTILDRGDLLGDPLREYPEDILPPEVIREEISVLETLGADFRPGSVLDEKAFAGLRAEFDAVFIDCEGVAGCNLPLKRNSGGEIVIDPATGATGEEGVFAGGGTRLSGAFSPVTEALQGRKGALSIERFLQNVQLSTGRENDGPFKTSLFTSVADIEPRPRTVPAESGAGYSSEEALVEAGRCIQCECMECVKVCLYLERYRGYPKIYARQIFNNEKVIFGAAHTKNQFVNSCSACGLCETVCPNDFYMGGLCLQARRTMNEQKFMPASFHEFALNDMEHANGAGFALDRHQPGKEGSAWLYFPSCQLSATSPGAVLDSYHHLRERLPGGVGVMLRCCGAPAFWAGREDLFREGMAEIRAAWEGMGRPRVITACSTCRSLFAEHIPDMETRPIWEVMEEAGLPSGGPAIASSLKGKKVAVADPCIVRSDPETRQSVRRIIGALGFSIDELSLSGDKPECCGFGGLMFNANPDLARDVMAHRTGKANIAPSHSFTPPAGWYRTRLRENADTAYYHTTAGNSDYIAYCAMCRDNLAAAGKRTAHLLELIFPGSDNPDPAARGWISWSERRRNRESVKGAILAEHGDTGGAPMEDWGNIRLDMTDEARKRMDDRRILENDIRKVIDHAEQSGNRLRNTGTGHFLAYLQSGNVTFWVEYSPGDDGFNIHNAYCHRMKIVGIMK
ncbi:MAG TPA: 4Fe-4S dicluster domain-containing protein [Geobacteraceae bacterium]|nr:4Fe-4S dicluster domain-containing protein [Geobacteraceae bacterium]